MKILTASILAISILIGGGPAQAASHWYPAGYTVDPSINSNVAFKAVPSNQAGNCAWCSARHGFNYWKVDFIAKKACSNFYMNSSLYSQSKAFEGTWYQKGFYQPAMRPFRLEIVTTDPHSYYLITQIIC